MRSKIFLLMLLGFLFGLQACASKPSATQISALKEQKAASDAAESRAQILINERDALKQELDQELAIQEQHKAELKALEGATP